MARIELTFDAADDLVRAFEGGRFPDTGSLPSLFVGDLGPAIELALQSKAERFPHINVCLTSEEPDCQFFLSALLDGSAFWFSGGRTSGFLRTTYNLLSESPNTARTDFLIAVKAAAEKAGFHADTARSFAAAIREMESNIFEHSSHATSGILAFSVNKSRFEFIVADAGLGVLATLREAPEYQSLSDHGEALQTTLQRGASRHGLSANRGNGFNELFVGLANLNADLRFRSGDHALTISGGSPSTKVSMLSQHGHFQGFLMSARCRV